MKEDVRGNGWFLFFCGLLVSTFIGGAVRSLLSPEQLRNWVEPYIAQKELPIEIHFDRIELKLSDYLLPRFGVVIHDVRLEAKESCLTRSQVHIDHIYFPIELSSLLTSRLKLNHVAANKVEVLWRSSVCNAETSEKSRVLEGVEFLTKDKIIEQGLSHFLPYQKSFSSFMKNRWKQEVSNTKKWIEGLSVGELQVYRQDKAKSLLLFSMSDLDFNLYPEKNHLHVDGKAQFFPLSIWKDNFGQMKFSFHLLPDKYSLDLHGWYKEGVVTAHAESHFDEDIVRVESKFKDLPVNSMLEVLSEFELVRSPEDLSFFWFNCTVNAEVDMRIQPKLKLDLKKCQASGDEGTLTVETVSYDVRKNHFHDISILFDKMKIRNFIKLLETPFLEDFDDKLAELSGALKIKNWDEMFFSGAVSRYPTQQIWRNIKLFKDVETLPIEMVLSKDRVSTLSKGMVVDGRPVKGFVSSNFDRAMKKGIMQVRIDKLQYGAEDGDSIQVFGQVTFKEGQIFSWRGYLGALAMNGENWRAQRIKVSGRFSEGVIYGHWKMKKLLLQANHKWYELLRPLFLRHRDLGEELSFNNTKFRFRVIGENVIWDKFNAASDVGKARFYSKGTVGKENINGHILVRFPRLKTLTWNLSGTEAQLSLEPSPEMLKALARESKQKKDLQDFGQLKQLDFLKNFMQREIENLKSFGKKVISQADKSKDDSGKEKDSSPKEKVEVKDQKK